MVRKDSKPARTVTGSLGSGRLATLEAVRVELARLLDGASCCRECGLEIKEPPASKAQISKELRAVLSEIAELCPAEVMPSAVDEITRRREDRIAAAHVAGSSVRRVRQRGG